MKKTPMKESPKKNRALMAVGAIASCIAAIILLVKSALDNDGEPNTATFVIATLLMGVGVVLAFYVKKKRNDEIALEMNPTPEPLDEEWDALMDYFYDMNREDEFYSCLEAYGPIEYIDDYEDGIAAFEAVETEAEAVGSKEYIWRTNRDREVCQRCRRYNGKRFAWNDAPLGDHPGCAPGCRCLAEPVMPLDRPRSGKSAPKIKK